MRKKVWGAIAVATAAVAVFASSQQSFALWSDSASAAGGVATAGNVNLTVGTSAGTSAAYTLSNLTTGATPLVPGNTVQAPVTVKNSGTDPLVWRMQSTTQLTGFSLTTYAAANEAACPAGVNLAAPASAVVMATASMGASLQYPVSPAYMPAALAGGGSYVLCLRLSVDGTATSTTAPSGATNTVTLTFQAGAV
ncbi:hypothetical protein QM716_20185 [Rhodococcus sp. IEGM 1409]|uniref:hypothetical protein n=1 Tax=Rhodococcus sp. IEGM 1409 TaxID=3047082 RepID=UPI0024B65006|nr:hypothetical protein [Rhodococcus sp. IEGM 1409]MDI9902177.1 hypothetical protein [Rhodococcus sp. IEGM 1409]